MIIGKNKKCEQSPFYRVLQQPHGGSSHFVKTNLSLKTRRGEYKLQYQFKQLIWMFQNQKSFQRHSIHAFPDPQDSLPSECDSSSDQSAPLKDGLWSQEQVFKFISYLIYNRQALKLKLQRRTSKVFKQMALFITTRTSVQCRSQNQRLFRKYKSMRNIVASFKTEYGCDRFEQDYCRIVTDPTIKFKTEYENYLQQQVKKACEVATQTEGLPLSLPECFYFPSPLPFSAEYAVPYNGTISNWVIIPFCS